jgi:hypothetical protein
MGNGAGVEPAVRRVLARLPCSTSSTPARQPCELAPGRSGRPRLRLAAKICRSAPGRLSFNFALKFCSSALRIPLATRLLCILARDGVASARARSRAWRGCFRGYGQRQLGLSAPATGDQALRQIAERLARPVAPASSNAATSRCNLGWQWLEPCLDRGKRLCTRARAACDRHVEYLLASQLAPISTCSSSRSGPRPASKPTCRRRCSAPPISAQRSVRIARSATLHRRCSTTHEPSAAASNSPTSKSMVRIQAASPATSPGVERIKHASGNRQRSYGGRKQHTLRWVPATGVFAPNTAVTQWPQPARCTQQRGSLKG